MSIGKLGIVSGKGKAVPTDPYAIQVLPVARWIADDAAHIIDPVSGNISTLHDYTGNGHDASTSILSQQFPKTSRGIHVTGQLTLSQSFQLTAANGMSLVIIAENPYNVFPPLLDSVRDRQDIVFTYQNTELYTGFNGSNLAAKNAGYEFGGSLWNSNAYMSAITPGGFFGKYPLNLNNKIMYFIRLPAIAVGSLRQPRLLEVISNTGTIIDMLRQAYFYTSTNFNAIDETISHIGRGFNTQNTIQGINDIMLFDSSLTDAEILGIHTDLSGVYGL